MDTHTHILSIPGFSEPVACWTHLLGALAVAIASVALVRRGRGPGERLALGVFAFGAFFMFAMSGVYHLLEPGGAPRAVLQRLDHAGIFVQIAGSFTAIHGVLFRGGWRWSIPVLVWVVAITGLTLKTIFFDSVGEGFGLALYLGLGWLGAVTAFALWRSRRRAAIRGLIGGGLAYSVGALLELFQWPTVIPGVVGPHELFHLGVLAGVALHWRVVSRALAEPVPERPRAAAAPRPERLVQSHQMAATPAK